jgi:hypothetical protein
MIYLWLFRNFGVGIDDKASHYEIALCAPCQPGAPWPASRRASLKNVNQGSISCSETVRFKLDQLIGTLHFNVNAALPARAILIKLPIEADFLHLSFHLFDHGTSGDSLLAQLARWLEVGWQRGSGLG